MIGNIQLDLNSNILLTLYIQRSDFVFGSYSLLPNLSWLIIVRDFYICKLPIETTDNILKITF